MSNRVTNQMLTRQINHLTQHLPKKEELNGVISGSSHYRKINDDSFCDAFKRSHKQLNGLKDKYQLTTEQESFISEAQIRLMDDVKDAFSKSLTLSANVQDFLSGDKSDKC
jgi:hypothetical protein